MACGGIAGMGGRDPRRDKELDHVRREGTSGHGFRQHWPARKAFVHRAYRARWSALLRQAATDADPDDGQLRAPRRGREPTGLLEPKSVRAGRSAARRQVDRVDSYLTVPQNPAAHRKPVAAAVVALLRTTASGEATAGRQSGASTCCSASRCGRRVGSMSGPLATHPSRGTPPATSNWARSGTPIPTGDRIRCGRTAAAGSPTSYATKQSASGASSSGCATVTGAFSQPADRNCSRK
jgi:hypothetical protein